MGYAGNRFPDETLLPLLLETCGLEWSAVVGLKAAVNAEITNAEIFLQV